MARFVIVTGRLRRAMAGMLGVVGLCLLASCAASAPRDTSESAAGGAATSPAIDQDLALATFDSAWSRIHNSYYDSTFRGLDWPAIGAEYRPQAAAVRTVAELRRVLNTMLGRLGESHFGIIPREAVDEIDDGVARERSDADAGIELRWVGDELMVTHVRPGGAGEVAGVGTGWIVEAIGEHEAAVWRTAIAGAESPAARRGLLTGTLSAATNRLSGAAGTIVEVRFRDAGDRSVKLALQRQPLRGEPVRFGNLPTFFSYLEHRRETLADGGCAGIVHFNVWMPNLVAEFNRAIDALADCHGMIIDVRGNPGGVGGMVMSTSGSFFDRNVPLGVLRTRGGEVRFVSMPRRITDAGRPRDTFTGPIAVLVDEQSMSTSEIFAAGMQATGRARVFGTPTPGYALPALMLRLPTQDVLYHAIANLTDPTGRRIEGAGVMPDEPLPLTRTDLLAGRDRVLEAALTWIGAQPRASTSGQ